MLMAVYKNTNIVAWNQNENFKHGLTLAKTTDTSISDGIKTEKTALHYADEKVSVLSNL